MPKSLDQMGTLQRRVMETLWRIGEGSVHDVLDGFPACKTDEDKPPAYTTVLTVLVGGELGLLGQVGDGGALLYRDLAVI